MKAPTLRFLKARVLLTVLLCTATSCFAFDIFIPALPQIVVHLNINKVQGQMIMSALFLGTLLTLLICGALADAYGRKKIMIIFLSIMTFASWMICISTHYHWIIFWRFIQGIGSGVIFSMGFTLISDIYQDRKRAVYMAYLSSSLTFFFTLAPIIGGYITHLWNWQATFILVSILSTLSCTMSIFLLPETLKTTQKLHWAQLFATYKKIFTSKAFLGFSLTPGLMIGAIIAYISICAHYLVGGNKLSEVHYGWYQSLFMITQSITGYGLGFFINRFGSASCLRFSVYGGLSTSLFFFLTLYIYPGVLWLQTLSMLAFAICVNISVITHIERGLALFSQTRATTLSVQGALRVATIAFTIQFAGLLTDGRTIEALGEFILLIGISVMIIHLTFTKKSLLVK